jgi:ornithine carbamoyltransferase
LKNFISIGDLGQKEFDSLLEDALHLKKQGWQNVLNERTLALVFEKPSLRTRVSFEVAMRQLGGTAIYLSPGEIGLGKRESVADVARVLGRYVNAIAARTFAHQTVEDLARFAGVPVINALSDYEHPCQAMADMLTIRGKKGDLKKVILTYIGDGNNVANSLLLAAVLAGAEFRIAAPAGYEILPKVMAKARSLARATGARITAMTDPAEAASGADVLYTDVWTSMGQEAEAEERRRVFACYQINTKIIARADKNVIVMHPLPAHHGEEIAAGITDGPHSVVFDQAENRLHAQKAILLSLLAK